MTRRSGQTGAEYMMVISTVVVAIVGSSFVFVPSFRNGVQVLGADVRHALSTGSFAGLGRYNATSQDAETGNGMDEGGAEGSNNGLSQQVSNVLNSVPFVGTSMADAVRQGIQNAQLAAQQSGGAPPVGIDGEVCGIWAISYLASVLGIDNAELARLMEIARNTPGVLLNDKDYRIDRIGMRILLDKLGVQQDWTRGEDFPRSKGWLDGELDRGRHPAVIVMKDGRPHWMVVTGRTTDEFGRTTGYTFQDSTTSEPQTMTPQEFQEAWAQAGNEGVSVGRGRIVATAD